METDWEICGGLGLGRLECERGDAKRENGERKIAGTPWGNGVIDVMKQGTPCSCRNSPGFDVVKFVQDNS